VGWATRHIAKLKEGETVQFRPRGASMTGRINSGDLCTVAPLAETALEVGQVVLCIVRGTHYLHIVSGKRGDQYQISNNRGHINGWTPRKNVYGVLTKVEP
jgi:hypothetical protein